MSRDDSSDDEIDCAIFNSYMLDGGLDMTEDTRDKIHFNINLLGIHTINC